MKLHELNELHFIAEERKKDTNAKIKSGNHEILLFLSLLTPAMQLNLLNIMTFSIVVIDCIFYETFS